MKRVAALCMVVLGLGMALQAGAAPRRKSSEPTPRDLLAAGSLGALPPVDAAEIYVLGPRTFTEAKPEKVDGGIPPGLPPTLSFPVKPYREFATVRQYRRLNATEAEGLARLWRSQVFDESLAKACHKPAHGLRFFNAGKLVMETSLSWDCRNFYVPDVSDHRWHGLDVDAPAGVQLLRELLKLLPPDPAAP